MSNPARTEEDITAGLLALIAYAGNASAACRSLKAEGKLDVSATTLKGWSTGLYAARYDELREKYRDQLEAKLVHEYRDIIALAQEGTREAVAKARARLKAGDDNDPGRTAANLATVATKATDKMLSLSGRPTNITESRNFEESLRKLISMGVIKPPEEIEGEVVSDSQPQLQEATNGNGR